MDQAHFSTLKGGAPKQTKFPSVRLFPFAYLPVETGKGYADIGLPWRYDGFRA
jgi:hypothetical protein